MTRETVELLERPGPSLFEDPDQHDTVTTGDIAQRFRACLVGPCRRRRHV